MAGVAEIVAGAVEGAGNLGLGIWNAYQSYQNNQYQKRLQKQLFAREDNAIQRRVADAEAAGFNKFSVMGEGSPAGGAVSVQAPHISEDLGSKVADTLSTMYSLATQKALAKKADAEAKQSDVAFKLAENKLLSDNMATTLERLDFLQGLGLNPQFDPDTNQFYIDDNGVGYKLKYSDTPYGRMNENTFSTADTNLEMLEFENEYKWLKPLLLVLDRLNQSAGTINSFRRFGRRR